MCCRRRALFFGAGIGGIDERFAQIQAAARVEILRQRLDDAAQRPGPGPGLEPAMAGLIGRVAAGQVFPRRTCPKNPEDAIPHIPRIPPRAAAAIATEARLRQQRFQNGPLRVGQIHAVEYDGHRRFVHCR